MPRPPKPPSGRRHTISLRLTPVERADVYAAAAAAGDTVSEWLRAVIADAVVADLVRQRRKTDP